MRHLSTFLFLFLSLTSSASANECPPGMYQFLSYCAHCPAGTTSLAGAVNSTQCFETTDGGSGGFVSTSLQGFNVLSVNYDALNWQWVIRVQYTPPSSPGTIASLYLSRVGLAPYSPAVMGTFQSAEHPCLQSNLPCCLEAYKDLYTVGSFSQNITGAGVCNFSGATNTLFASPLDTVDSVFALHERSSVERLDASTVDLHVHVSDLSDFFALSTETASGVLLDFFVGISYFSLLSSNSLITFATQSEIQVQRTEGMIFSTTSQQDFTVVQHIALAVYDIETPEAKHAQVARADIVFPTGLQRAEGGPVIVESVQFAIARSLPGIDDALWQGACGNVSSLYAEAASQECSIAFDVCENPIDLASDIVRFWFPLGVGAINASILESGEYTLFISFDVELFDTGGRVILSRISTQSPINGVSLTRVCTKIARERDVSDIIEVHYMFGLLPDSEPRNGSLAKGADINHISVDKARSIQDAMLTIVFEGGQAFANDTSFSIEIDSMVSLHILRDEDFHLIKDAMSDGGFSVVRDEGGFYAVGLMPNVTELCDTELCRIRVDIAQRAVAESYAAAYLSPDSLEAENWIQQNMVGHAEYGKQVSSAFTARAISTYRINDRYRRAVLFNPFYPWNYFSGPIGVSSHILLAFVATVSGPSGANRRLLTHEDSSVYTAYLRFDTYSYSDLSMRDSAANYTEERSSETWEYHSISSSSTAIRGALPLCIVFFLTFTMCTFEDLYGAH